MEEFNPNQLHTLEAIKEPDAQELGYQISGWLSTLKAMRHLGEQPGLTDYVLTHQNNIIKALCLNLRDGEIDQFREKINKYGQFPDPDEPHFKFAYNIGFIDQDGEMQKSLDYALAYMEGDPEEVIYMNEDYNINSLTRLVDEVAAFQQDQLINELKPYGDNAKLLLIIEKIRLNSTYYIGEYDQAIG